MIDDGRVIRRGWPRIARGRRRRHGAGFLTPRLRARLLVGLIAAALLFGGAWLWFRDSSLVAVRHVNVTGASGPDARQIRGALTAAARNMTTLDVSMSELRTAVAPYPDVKNLAVSTQFPHGIRIRVIEQIPVAAVVVAGQTIAVAGDGTLLHDSVGASKLPRIPLPVPPGGTRLTGAALGAVSVLAAAPYQLLGQVAEVTISARHGLTAQIRNGPSIYFGDGQRLAAKWTAAVAVLADPSSAGAVYIDVSDPERPAAGASTPSSATSGATGSASSTAGTSPTTPAIPTSPTTSPTTTPSGG
jgi:cell division protein FtsQ